MILLRLSCDVKKNLIDCGNFKGLTFFIRAPGITLTKTPYILKFYTNYMQNVVLSYVNMLPMAVIIQCAHITLITWRKATVPEDCLLLAINAAISKKKKNALG